MLHQAPSWEPCLQPLGFSEGHLQLWGGSSQPRSPSSMWVFLPEDVFWLPCPCTCQARSSGEFRKSQTWASNSEGYELMDNRFLVGQFWDGCEMQYFRRSRAEGGTAAHGGKVLAHRLFICLSLPRLTSPELYSASLDHLPNKLLVPGFFLKLCAGENPN